MNEILASDPRVEPLIGGVRDWWDVTSKTFVSAGTVYLPQGCTDWGERGGKRNSLCTFCALPNAVADYRTAFYGGDFVPAEHHISLFRGALSQLLDLSSDLTQLMIFNAGSFLADSSNPLETRAGIMEIVANTSAIQRVIVESRAELVTPESIFPLVEVLSSKGKQLTVRIGIETQDDDLRLKVLRKGHSRNQLRAAVRTLKDLGVLSGGYALLKPAPGMETDAALAEAKSTLDFILGTSANQLAMDEAYFCSTNVGPGTPLTTHWLEGSFAPVNLWMVLDVLHYGVEQYGDRVHLLPFRDEPELLAVPSNHVAKGIPQSLDGAAGCDLQFHVMLDRYRATMNRSMLVSPDCSCRPAWFA